MMKLLRKSNLKITGMMGIETRLTFIAVEIIQFYLKSECCLEV
jgi:hypothetical protein